METWLSWTIFLGVIGAAYLFYSKPGSRGRAKGRSIHRTTATSSNEPAQWSDAETKPKTAAKPKPKAPRKQAKKTAQDVGGKAETSFSAGSSTAGADADDDLSPTASPMPVANATPSGKDVSDMLDPKLPTPGVLKIGASDKPAGQNKPKQQRPETPKETKKQRQNRKKQEEQKAQREEDEKIRKAREESQRRTARESRGEPARNGVPIPQAPTSNPWTTARSSGAVQQPAPATSGPLLDTFEAASTASSSEAATNGTAPTPDSMPPNGNYKNLPSEEEQVRLAMEDSAWTTVPGKKQRKAKAATSGDEEGSDAGNPQEAAPVKAAPVRPAPAQQTQSTKSASRFDILSAPVPNVGHPDDSDWPVV